MRAYLQLGKLGDIITITPILNAEFQRTGIPPKLVVAREYAPLVNELDYVEPVIFDGSWQDLRGALKFAKGQFSEVICTQIYGREFPFEHRHPSFQYDIWDRAGCLSQWDKLPTVLPRLSEAVPGKKTILFADNSQSSPFFYKEELNTLLKDTFPNHKIVRLSEIRLKTLLHSLPMIDQADLVVCIDTAHMHLSAASQTPAIAIVTDRPETWHGTAWSKRFAFHCRYDDFLFRRDELRAAMLAAVNKTRGIEPAIVSTAHPHGYNMSIETVDNLPITTYRYHSGSWKTKLAISYKGHTSDIVFPKECDQFSMEDARLFWFSGSLHIAYTCAIEIGGAFKSVQAYGELLESGGVWSVKKHNLINFKGNDFSGMQKNWVPFENDGRLYFIYGNNQRTQFILEVRGTSVSSESKSPELLWGYGEIRGGSVVRDGDKMIRVFHSKTGSGHRHYKFRYYLGASIMESKPPFKTIAVSKIPILAGNEKYTPGCKHWKPNCILPYGIVKTGSDYRATVGLNDCECAMITLGIENLKI